MRQLSPTVRRDFLRRVGLGLAGLFVGSAASGSSGSRLFAGQFLRDKKATQLPQGYYDPVSQLYRNAATGEAMFVSEEETSVTPLSTEELLEMIKSGRFVDVSKNPFYEPKATHITQGMATWSQQTTLSTTTCCPIVTDKEKDTGPDDTWPYPPR